MENIIRELEDFGIVSPVIIKLDTPQSGKPAYAIKINSEDRYLIWDHLYNLKLKLNAYPIVCATWGSTSSSWSKSIQTEDVFSRFYFEEESLDGGVSPKNIIEKAEQADWGSILHDHNKVYSKDIVDSISYCIDSLKTIYGKYPSEQDILNQMSNGTIKDYFSLHEWLMEWSEKEVGINRLSQEPTDFLSWYEPCGQEEFIVLLPVTNGWESIAFLHWFGASTTSTPKAMALLKYWNREYGAELVAHYGTILHLRVNKRPRTLQEAFKLAKEQESFAPCTTVLPGATLLELAVALMSKDIWFLHERP